MRYYGGTVLQEKNNQIKTIKQVSWWKLVVKTLLFPLLFLLWMIQFSIHLCLESDEN